MSHIGCSFKGSCWSCWKYIFKSSPGSLTYGNLRKRFCLKVILGHLVRMELFWDICFLTCLTWRCGVWHCFESRAEECLCNTCWSPTVPFSYLCVFKIQCFSKSRLYFSSKCILWFKEQLYHTTNLATLHACELLKWYTRLTLKALSSLEKKKKITNICLFSDHTIKKKSYITVFKLQF